MDDIIHTISLAMNFIFLVFLVKHMFVDSIKPHESFVMSVKRLSLKFLSKIITFHISRWLVNNSADVSGFDLVSYIKVSYVIVFGSFDA